MNFFDFFNIGEGKVGLIIGDVTGKSVSGALIMSASRSVFRMLSEEELSVGETMIRANRRIKKDIKSGMFVALLYAVLNAEKGTVGLCSAGQTQPILISAKSAEAVLIETVGDTFPLGILAEANYEETQLELMPGDKVVFYTDGIVEAMNKREEMYGFERLQEVIKSSPAETAEEFVARVNDELVGIGKEGAAAAWVRSTYITGDTAIIAAAARLNSSVWLDRDSNWDSLWRKAASMRFKRVISMPSMTMPTTRARLKT